MTTQGLLIFGALNSLIMISGAGLNSRSGVPGLQRRLSAIVGDISPPIALSKACGARTSFVRFREVVALVYMVSPGAGITAAFGSITDAERFFRSTTEAVV